MEIKIIRKIDKLCRIVIPNDVRRSLDLKKGDAIAITVENGAVVLRKISENEGNWPKLKKSFLSGERFMDYCQLIIPKVIQNDSIDVVE